MSATRKWMFVTLVAAQALIPLGMIAHSEIKLSSGHRVRFMTAPVDPLDLFRGYYVRLNYEFSNLRVPGGSLPGETVYVKVFRKGDIWDSAGTATLHRPSSGTFLRGKIVSVYGHSAEMKYGIETYYADEDEARRLEGQSRLFVNVVLDDDGGGRVSGVSPIR